MFTFILDKITTKAEEELMFRIAKSNDPILMMKLLDFIFKKEN